MVDQRALIDGAAALDVALTPLDAERFERYAVELLDWNRRVNLTAITDPLEIVHKHFLDSLALIACCGFQTGGSIIDVGSGAGFPGLPIALARPDLQVTLLEATRKKCDFLRHLVATLGVGNVSVVQARAENAARDPAHRERHAVAVARAVAEMATLAEYLLPLVRIGGWIVAQKSGEIEAEVGRAGAAIMALGGHLRRIAPLRLPGIEEARYAVIVDKIAPTPDRYPRRAGMPEKRPIG